VLANHESLTFGELQGHLGHQTRHIERLLEVLRRMAVCWRDGEVHRHYFLRLLGDDARYWQSLLKRVEVSDTDHWISYFREIAVARFE
jgi:hypothetical protein